MGRVEGITGETIATVEPLLLSYRYPPGQEQMFEGGHVPGVTAGLVKVTTRGGVIGFGETYAGYWRPEAVLEWVPIFGEALNGRDVADITGAWDAARATAARRRGSATGLAVFSAVECALWDLCGTLLGVPVWRLLGGLAHEHLPRYASGGTRDPEHTLAAEMRGYVASGFVAAKIRGGVAPDVDEARASVARAALGPDRGLAFDCVQGTLGGAWDATAAIAIGRRLAPFGLLWLEEPCALADVNGYQECRRALDIPIAGGESLVGFDRFERFLTHDAVDIVQPDASHAGGILQARLVAALAEDLGIGVAVHAWAGGACLMANYHAAFASPAAQWLEFPPQANPFVEGLLTEPLAVEDGMVRAPSRPGLGVSVPEVLVDAHPYDPTCSYVLDGRRRR